MQAESNFVPPVVSNGVGGVFLTLTKTRNPVAIPVAKGSRRRVIHDSDDDDILAIAFTDGLTGTRVSLALVADGQLQTPAQLRAQIMRPLLLMQAAAWFFARQSTGMKRHREEPPPLGHMLTEFSPRVPARVMFGCVATACRRLATASAGIFRNPSRTTERWAAWILERVTAGRVMKVQVRLQRRACCDVRCVSLTRAAGNAGWFACAFLFVCAAVAWARSAAFILVCRLLLPPALQAVPTF